MGFFDSLLGNSSADASNAAAQDTYAKQQAAIKNLTSYGDTLPGQYKDIAKGFDPYVSAGGDALKRLMAGLGLGSSQDSIDFTKAYRDTPGYTAGLETGLTGAERGFNAGNMGQSGAALKGLYKYGSNYEDQRSNDYLAKLLGLTNTGATATGAQVGTEVAGLGANTDIRKTAYGGDYGSAPTVGQGMVAGEQAKQSALTNLMGMGSYVAGSFLGGPGGKALSTRLFA